MGKYILILLIVLFGAFTIATVSFDIGSKSITQEIESFFASLFFVDSSTPEKLQGLFKDAQNGKERISILIVPGHDDEFSGTEYRGMREADLTIELAEKLSTLFSRNPLFSTRTTRTRNGYDPALAAFFSERRGEIQQFMSSQRATMEHYVSGGTIETRTNVEHNTAPSEMAHRLYGINKWANDSGVDIVVHIHFNDHPRTNLGRPGIYTGFSIYVPEKQYSNAKGSRALAESIFKYLSVFYPSSNLPKEDAGIVEDQELIAVGSNNSVDGAALLIEYGYIYEPLLQDPALRTMLIDDFALHTYRGILTFLEESEDTTPQTSYLPYNWKLNLSRGMRNHRDIVSLQAALILEGVYPPNSKSKNDCPLSGTFGTCTEEAVKAFQKKHTIVPSSGVVGSRTRERLNKLYGEN